MQLVISRQKLAPIAERAYYAWKNRFENKKETWIINNSKQLVGWFKKKAVGREQAEINFTLSELFTTRGASGGIYWYELFAVDTAKRLMDAALVDGPTNIILTEKDFGVLYPVMNDYVSSLLIMSDDVALVLARPGTGL